jgi:carboxyl-terminal processing protease
MESTHGKYEGLGMRIDTRDDRVVIISPIEGTPAYRRGLRAGDVIWEIDGNATYEMTSSEAADLMRGPAGTSVVLKIKRQGIAELLEFEVQRAVITLKSVNYHGVIPQTDIGYVRLSRFAEETSQELRDAITDLNNQGVSSLIFDLRSNGGGLLDQAKETAELFLENGREIVYTKGKYEDSERHFHADRDPIFPKDKPLVILVDEGTASASEIVAGAIQDWDRGVIVGNTTYGKGLVQQIFPISNDVQLKLTTAKYYIPSGRCIQKPEKQQKGAPHARADLDDEEGDGEAADTLAVEEKEIFYTNGGRVVYGGGGIVPDIILERETWQPIEINLERKSMFFDFAVQYVAKHPGLTVDFEVTDETVEDFRAFLQEQDFSYKSALQVALEDMEERVKDEGKEDLFAADLTDMRNLVEKEKERDFDRSMDYIRRSIKREVISSIAGESGVYEQLLLKSDKAVKEAVRVLSTPAEYSKMITEGNREES